MREILWVVLTAAHGYFLIAEALGMKALGMEGPQHD